MSYRKKNFGLPGILDGTTASEAELQDDARKAVMKKLGVSSWAKPSMHAPMDQEDDLWIEIPIKKETPIVEVKDEHGFTPKENAEIHKYLTRPPTTDSQKEAAAFWEADRDKSGTKMVAYVDTMRKKYDGVDEDIGAAKPAGKNKGFKYESWANRITAEQNLANKANAKTVKQLTDLKNWSNNSKKV